MYTIYTKHGLRAHNKENELIEQLFVLPEHCELLSQASASSVEIVFPRSHRDVTLSLNSYPSLPQSMK